MDHHSILKHVLGILSTTGDATKPSVSNSPILS